VPCDKYPAPHDGLSAEWRRCAIVGGMSQSSTPPAPVIAVTGANGLVGAGICAALVDRGAQVRALVRRPGTAPTGTGVQEWVGDFMDPRMAAEVVDGADAVVTTVHPMGTDRDNQHRVAVEGTAAFARAARDAGVHRMVHISTAAVYDRSPGMGDVDEASPLVGDDADAYAVTKRDTDSALAEVEGITRVLLRPPAILGPGRTSTWNTVRPARIRRDASARHVVPEQTFAWVHVRDLARLAADLACDCVPASTEPERGPVAAGCTVVNVAAAAATARDYYQTVTAALGLEPVWEERPAWTGRILSDRAHHWGWAPNVDLTTALTEIEQGLTP
jgi:nucleoside-diphosphate-sugar epimerase